MLDMDTVLGMKGWHSVLSWYIFGEMYICPVFLDVYQTPP